MPSWTWQVSRRILRGDPPSLVQIAEHHGVIEDAVCLYYSPENPNFPRLFAFNTPEEIRTNRDERLREARTASSLTLLAAIEASFRLDYRQRNSSRKRDDLSRAFRTLYKQRENRVSFSDEILQGWLDHSDVKPALVRDIRAAFKYRHWLAHGRYWTPKLGRQYDFETIYDLGCRIESTFPFLHS